MVCLDVRAVAPVQAVEKKVISKIEPPKTDPLTVWPQSTLMCLLGEVWGRFLGPPCSFLYATKERLFNGRRALQLLDGLVVGIFWGGDSMGHGSAPMHWRRSRTARPSGTLPSTSATTSLGPGFPALVARPPVNNHLTQNLLQDLGRV